MSAKKVETLSRIALERSEEIRELRQILASALTRISELEAENATAFQRGYTEGCSDTVYDANQAGVTI